MHTVGSVEEREILYSDFSAQSPRLFPIESASSDSYNIINL